MRSIHLTRLDTLSPGELICDVDDDALTTDDAINASYAHDDQDWYVVVKRRGHADVGELLIQMYDGSREWTRVTWDGLVWVLVDDGERVVDSDVAHEGR